MHESYSYLNLLLGITGVLSSKKLLFYSIRTNKKQRKLFFAYSLYFLRILVFMCWHFKSIKPNCSQHIIILTEVHYCINAGNFACISYSLQSTKFFPKFYEKYLLGRLYLNHHRRLVAIINRLK